MVDTSKIDSKVDGEEKKISRDRAKLKSFYDFKIDDKKLDTIKQRTWSSQKRVFLVGIAFGFFTEYLLGNTRIYENIVRKATMRRLSNVIDNICI